MKTEDEAGGLDKRMTIAAVAVFIVALILIVVLSLRPAVQATLPPTPAATQDLDPVRTEAVETFAAGLTATSAAAPTMTPTDTQAATETGATVEATSTSLTPATAGPSPTAECLGLHFVRDVSIPDNTVMTPASVFTKSWLVENSGTCPWQAGFQVVLIGGIAMGGSPFQLAQDVGPGGRIQVSIKMVAPTNQTGIVQGTWKMADSTGKTFGDYMSVVIVVGTGTGQPLPTARPTSTP